MSYLSTILADTPDGYFRLNTGAIATDSSGNGRNGTLLGTNFVAASALVSGGDAAQTFDSPTSDGAVTLPTFFNYTGAFSVELWFRPTTIDASFRRLIGFTDDGTHTQGYELGYHSTAGIFNGRYVAGVGNGGSLLPSVWNTSTIYYAVLTYDTADVRLHIRGAGVTPDTRNDADARAMGAYGAISARIGMGQFGGSGAKAVIDEVALYGYKLTPTQVDAHYAAGTAGTSTFTKQAAGIVGRL